MCRLRPAVPKEPIATDTNGEASFKIEPIDSGAVGSARRRGIRRAWRRLVAGEPRRRCGPVWSLCGVRCMPPCLPRAVADPDRPPGQRVSVADARGRVLDFEFDRIFDAAACTREREG